MMHESTAMWHDIMLCAMQAGQKKNIQLRHKLASEEASQHMIGDTEDS